MDYAYKTSGTCSRQIFFSVNDGVVSNVRFEGGCDGNLKGISRMVEGLKVEEVTKRLRGIVCGNKGTSCPDQLARALQEVSSK